MMQKKILNNIGPYRLYKFFQHSIIIFYYYLSLNIVSSQLLELNDSIIIFYYYLSLNIVSSQLLELNDSIISNCLSFG